MPTAPPQFDARAIVAALREWHDPAARPLPWRVGADAWGVLVSEVMSQQTQAARAGHRWRAFVERFPDPAALADAPTAEVLALWVGLGYNRRALNLQRAAEALVRSHGGRVPADLDALLALPGVGPYTARAVLVFAHGWQTLPVDTNVARVLSRVSGRVLARPAAQELADELAAAGPVHGAADLSAALMDLGAGLCRARGPRCIACPLSPLCGWRADPLAPDPAAAGAHRPRRQDAFDGSVRQARGRVVRALAAGALPEDEVVSLCGSHGPAVTDALIAEGMVVRCDVGGGHGFALPSMPGKA